MVDLGVNGVGWGESYLDRTCTVKLKGRVIGCGEFGSEALCAVGGGGKVGEFAGVGEVQADVLGRFYDFEETGEAVEVGGDFEASAFGVSPG